MGTSDFGERSPSEHWSILTSQHSPRFNSAHARDDHGFSQCPCPPRNSWRCHASETLWYLMQIFQGYIAISHCLGISSLVFGSRLRFMFVQGPQYSHGKLNHTWLGQQEAIRSSKYRLSCNLMKCWPKLMPNLMLLVLDLFSKVFLQILLLGQHSGQALGLGLSTDLAIRLSPTTAGSVAIRDKVNLLLAFLRDMILFPSCFWTDWDKGFWSSRSTQSVSP